MIRKSVTINCEGLEARPIAMLVQKASQFTSKVHIEIGNKLSEIAEKLRENMEEHYD